MEKPRVGLITFGDERDDMWEKVFKNLSEPRHKELQEYLESLSIELLYDKDVARTRDQINEQVDRLRAARVDVLVAHTPCWTSPNLVLHGIQRTGSPGSPCYQQKCRHSRDGWFSWSRRCSAPGGDSALEGSRKCRFSGNDAKSFYRSCAQHRRLML